MGWIRPAVASKCAAASPFWGAIRRDTGGPARYHAGHGARDGTIMATTIHQEVTIKASPARIVDVLYAQARHAMDVKRLDVAKAVEKLEGQGENAKED